MKKNPQTKIGRELINQGASTNLISGSTAPSSGHFQKISDNLWRQFDTDKKNPAKIGRELINQGASTNLISGSTAPSSRHFQKICDFTNPVSS
ncbi:hypothetical protein [Microcoleus sp. bin38.metabat.b11b12b14.051]|uniref:hypothetical protein n=1 Tax=Microcoleus sp. bin38.metabat.b11b12b14.051 TaxID=2742709 RepID=UPI0025CFF748|nr:hypothetical protein [Microcoleus sp. bin38.metabat.b11b12b14.051]